MQAALAAIGGLFSGGGAAAAAGTAAAGAGGAAATGLGGLAALKGGMALMSGISMLGKIGQGMEQAGIMRAQASEADLQGTQEMLAGQQRQNRIRREMASILGETKNKYAAAGVDLTGGIADSQARRTAQDAADQISIDRRDSEFVQAQYRARARNLRKQAGGASRAGLLSALETGANTAFDIARLGA